MKRRDFIKSMAAVTAVYTISGCSSTIPKKKPNILFCIADDASFPHMGAYGCEWIHTPGFDRVAKEGLLFTNAYTPNAKCAPSRASILTGRNSWQLEEAANHWCTFPNKFKTYAETLTEHGYHVGCTAKGWAPGVVGEVNGKKRELTGKRYNDIKTEPPAKHISNIDYAANFEAFLNERAQDQPFCFWYGSREPHRAYEYGAGIRKGNHDPSNIDKVFEFWPDNEIVRTDLLDYAFEIEYFDLHVQHMLDLLERRGELDNTLVVVTADNGMPFPRIKGQNYVLSNHLPMAMMWKEGIRKPGRVVDDFVSFIDLAPTFLDLANLSESQSGMQPVEGESLSPYFRTGKSGFINPKRDHVLIGKERHDVGRPGDVGYPVRGMVTKDYLYLHNYKPQRWPSGNPETGYLNVDGSPTKTECLKAIRDPKTYTYWNLSFGKRPEEELYHITEDPECMHNLAGDTGFQSVLQNLKSTMERELTQQGDPRMFGKGDVFDRYEYMDASSRHFYERYMNGEKLNAGWVNPSDFDNNF